MVDLEPQLIRLEHRVETWTEVVGDPRAWKPGDPTKQVTGPREFYVPVDNLAEAQGIYFYCPKCYRVNGGSGSHRVLCWFMGRGVPDETKPGPGRWPPIGTNVYDLTLGPGPNNLSSVRLEGGCGWHGYVQKGGVSIA